jgi:hypothetical protein
VQPSKLKNWSVVDGNTYIHLGGAHKGTLHDAQQTYTSAHETLVDQHRRQMCPALPQSWALEAAASSDAFAFEYMHRRSPEMHQPTTSAEPLNANRSAQIRPSGDSAICPEAWMVLRPNAHSYPAEKGQHYALAVVRIWKPRRLLALDFVQPRLQEPADAPIGRRAEIHWRMRQPPVPVAQPPMPVNTAVHKSGAAQQCQTSR